MRRRRCRVGAHPDHHGGNEPQHPPSDGDGRDGRIHREGADQGGETQQSENIEEIRSDDVADGDVGAASRARDQRGHQFGKSGARGDDGEADDAFGHADQAGQSYRTGHGCVGAQAQKRHAQGEHEEAVPHARGLLPCDRDDFGAQGEAPSHPDLLDWLAVQFIDGGFHLEELHRLILNSATYRRVATVDPQAREVDPDNRLLAYAPRFRRDAEFVRDGALRAAGVLVPELFGPPVRPLQPSLGLKAAFGGGIDWKTSEGEDRYRRTMYTFFYRSSPHPMLTTFDTSN